MKKLLSLALAVMLVMSLASVSVFAAAPDGEMGYAYDKDGALILLPSGGFGKMITLPDATNTAGGMWALVQMGEGYIGISRDLGMEVEPEMKLYFCFGNEGDELYLDSGNIVDPVYLLDKDFFKISVKKKENSKYLKTVKASTKDRLDDGMNRANYLCFDMADWTDVDKDLKVEGYVTFEAKKNYDEHEDKSGKPLVKGTSNWAKGDKIVLDYKLWLSNTAVYGNDGSTDLGSRTYFDPVKNDNNVMIWGDDLAALKYEADDSGDKFYTRMENVTKSDTYKDLYVNYADPVGADMWAYDFKTNPTIPSTSRGVLTLGIPWNEDADNFVAPDPEDCYIYQKIDGEWVDVTSQFTYSDDAEEIPGWSTKTRVLGTYILSDKELPLSSKTEAQPEDKPAETAPVGDKEIPNTGWIAA